MKNTDYLPAVSSNMAKTLAFLFVAMMNMNPSSANINADNAVMRHAITAFFHPRMI